ncbi:MAG: hypothetical protein JO309_08715 [Pseudonocardiales bacterium]|nr:hypothetical protein [Pseudonocardiales bacterium]MBV9729468.1 hypothetical protein [Pseudonocardiales bacterium]
MALDGAAPTPGQSGGLIDKTRAGNPEMDLLAAAPETLQPPQLALLKTRVNRSNSLSPWLSEDINE